MRFPGRIARAAPYAALLAVAAWLYAVAARIEYIGPQERIGPDFWPKAILALLGLLCAYEIAKSLFFRGPQSVSAMLQSLMQEAAETPAGGADAVAARQRPNPERLAWGVAVTLGYVLLVDWLGFFVATAAFLYGFVMVGGYRRWAVALAAGLGGSLAILVVFMKIVYVSLPLGVGPFHALSLAMLAILGVR